MLKKPEPQSLESYLSQIERELRDLPSQARADEMREIESHLRAMIEARGDGSIAEALRQFGKPRKVGRDLCKAWERKQPESWINSALALVAGCLFVSGDTLGGRFFSFSTYLQYFFAGNFGYHDKTLATYFLVEVLLSLIVGATIGFLSPKRSRIIIALSFLLLMLSNFFPDIAFGFWFRFPTIYVPRFSTYAFLLLCLLIGSRWGIRFSKKHKIQIV